MNRWTRDYEFSSEKANELVFSIDFILGGEKY